MSDFPTLVGYLKRTAAQAGYSMTVDTSMVKKLIAGVEVAEACVEASKHYDDPTGIDYADAVEEETAALAAYLKATGR